MSESAALVTYSVTEEQIAETKARYAAQLREIAMPTVNDPVLADALLVAWDALGSIADELERAAARRAA